jgi:hypothetical protein
MLCLHARPTQGRARQTETKISCEAVWYGFVVFGTHPEFELNEARGHGSAIDRAR